MATANINGIRIYYELSGTGEIPLVLVHGSWVSHHDWEFIRSGLDNNFRVLTYDRRGHSESERPSTPDSVSENVADLAGLIEHLDLAPAWLVGNSFGASITLRLAGERPDLFRGLITHEPPLFSLLANDSAVSSMLDEVARKLAAVSERIVSGDHAGAAELFVESVALGPGNWSKISRQLQSIMIENAPTFLDELNDPQQLDFNLQSVKPFPGPILLTAGAQSPAIFAPVVAKLAATLPNAEVVTFLEAGHIPHVTDPETYVEAIRRFIDKHGT
jgi:pimeloyl-ACP methyl ester carboxylesterase